MARSNTTAPGRSRRTQAERSTATRRRIVDAAIACLADGGFRAATMGSIADQAGVTVGAVQHQFGDKDGVLLAVLEHGLDQLVARLATVSPGSGSLDDRVRSLVHETWQGYRGREYQAVMEILRSMRNDPDFRDRSNAYMQRVREMIDRVWMGTFWDSEGSRQQHVAAQRLMFATLNGLALESYLSSVIPDATIELQALQDAVVSLLTPASSIATKTETPTATSTHPATEPSRPDA